LHPKNLTMSKIKIRDFGPVRGGFRDGDGWLDVNKVTVFIGDQGSGKSTVAKAIAMFSWLEKAMNRGDIKPGELNFKNVQQHFEFQGIRDYLKPETEISYAGKRFSISLNVKEKRFDVEDSGENGYIVPKIMYVPAERNFLSTIRDAFDVKGLPAHLFAFAEELRKAQKKYGNQKVDLPIPGYRYKYDDKADISYIVGNDHEVNLLNAASGFQAIVPLYLVTRFLANSTKSNGDQPERDILSVRQSVRMKEELSAALSDSKISEEEKQLHIEAIKRKFINKSFFNIVEEPEQNLFPASQRKLLNSLLKFNNYLSANKLLITTHSPYMINFLTLAVKANGLHHLLDQFKTDESLKEKLKNIVPLSATVKSSDLSIYQFDNTDGIIRKLGEIEGLPSDDNELNLQLDESNELFAQLLEIQQNAYEQYHF
jgi:predicted ATPase